MKKLVVIVLILSILVILVSCNGKKSDQTNKALNKYTIQLDISEDLLTVEQKVSVKFYNNTGFALDEIKFRLYPDAYRQDSPTCAYFSKLSKYGGIKVNQVSVGGIQTTFDAVATLLSVTLASPLPTNNEVDINIDCTLDVPQSDLRLGLINGTLKLANFYPVLCVYENGGWRTDEFYKVGNPFYSECADYEVSVNCADNLILAAAGGIISENPAGDGRKTVSIAAKAVRDFAIVASKDFKVAECIQGESTIKYYYTGNSSREAELAAAQTSLEVFGQTIGKYPYAVYSIVETEFYYGSAGFGNLAVISKDEADKTNLIIHETAHQWFGNMVGSDNITTGWQHEALVSFLSGYYHYLKGDKKAYETIRDGYKNEYVSYQSSQQKSKANKDFNIGKKLYQFSTNYEYGMMMQKKGFLVFDAVLNVVGKEKLNKALKAYFQSYLYANSSADQMLAVFDSATRQDVTAIVRSWLDGKTVIVGTIIYSAGTEA